MMTPRKKKFLVPILCMAGLLVAGTYIAERRFGTITILASRIMPTSWRLASSLDPFVTSRTLEQRNQELTEQNRVLSEQLATYREQTSRTAFDAATQAVFVNARVSDARVMGAVLGSGGKQIVVNAGTNQNVRVHDWVLIPQRTLIGRIQSVGPETSMVQTVFDPELKITASIATGTASGLFSFSNGAFTVDYIADTPAIAPGQVVVTSGQDGIFPKGFALGTTQSMTPSAHVPLSAVRVQSVFALASVDYVMIIRNTLETPAQQ